MPGHVLHLPEIVMLQPVGDHATADLFSIPNFRMVPVDIPEHVKQGAAKIFTAADTKEHPLTDQLPVNMIRFSCRSFLSGPFQYPGPYPFQVSIYFKDLMRL